MAHTTSFTLHLRPFFPATDSLLSSILMCLHRINQSLIISHRHSRILLHQYITISNDVFPMHVMYILCRIFLVCLILLKILLYKISAFVSQILVPGGIYLADFMKNSSLKTYTSRQQHLQHQLLSLLMTSSALRVTLNYANFCLVGISTTPVFKL